MYHSHGDIIDMMEKTSELGINLLVSLNKNVLGEEGKLPPIRGYVGRVQKCTQQATNRKMCGDVA
jgi:hypothetical protein